jgi:hypothetical protein
MQIVVAKPLDKERPFLFRHRYGTLTVYAVKQKKAVTKALKMAGGMPIVLALDNGKVAHAS